MDPSIVKLLEEDEDESMHSGADVEAFQAALNRDIEGVTSTSLPSDSNSAPHILPGPSSHTSTQSFTQWTTATRAENTVSQGHQSLETLQQNKQNSSETEGPQIGSISGNEQQQNILREPNRLTLQQQDQKHDNIIQLSTQNTPTSAMQISEKNPIQTDADQSHHQDSESQYLKLQKMSNQQATSTEQHGNPMNRANKQIPFAVLMPTLLSQLDKDRGMQLSTLYARLKKNEVPKEQFIRHMRDIVGDQMLKLAASKLQFQVGSSPLQMRSQAAARQNHLRGPFVSAGATQFTDPHSFAQLHQKISNSPAEPPHTPPVTTRMTPDSSYATIENSTKKPWEGEPPSDSRGALVGQTSSSNPSTISKDGERSATTIQGLNKQPQQHMQFPQTSFSMYGNSGGSYNSYHGTNSNTSVSSLKPQSHDSQMRQITPNQSMASSPFVGVPQPMNMMNVPKFERHSSVIDSNRMQGGSLSHFPNNSALQQNSVPWQSSTAKDKTSGPLSSMAFVKQESSDQASKQHKSLLSAPQGVTGSQVESSISGPPKDDLEKPSSAMGFSTSDSVSTSMVPSNLSSRIQSINYPAGIPAGINARMTPKKPSIGQKKPLESLGSSPPPSSKKQKVSGTFLDQSIEQLNDVTAVSGVNLREEEEQLFSGPKEDSRVSEASRKVVQEEEDRLLLQKIPLQKKLAEILAKCGLKNLSNDVERCLSLCAEERLRGLICNIIRLSKQRVDIERDRHRTIITSDVRQQIMTMNRKAREEWERKQAETEKLRKRNEPDADNGVDGDKDNEGRLKSVKVDKEEDDKMRTTAANVAARAAVGGDDMLSKWQLMAEQARQKREGGTDSASSSQVGKNVSRKPLSTSGRNAKDIQEVEKRGLMGHFSASGAVRNMGRNQSVPQTRVARTVSVKDVIAVLEREPQMSRSTLIYRLYEKASSESAAA